MNQDYARGQRVLECVSLGLFSVLAGWSLWRLATAAEGQFLGVVLIAFPIGWLASDLLSGILHWALDNLGSVKTPIIGGSFIRPFREHHIDPGAMTQHDFIETHGSSCFAALPVLAVSIVMALDSYGSYLLQGFLVSLALGALATNQCHKWAHMEPESIPFLIRWAQRYRLLLPPRDHQLHHCAPFNTHFCMSNGWLNPLFNTYLKLWR